MNALPKEFSRPILAYYEDLSHENFTIRILIPGKPLPLVFHAGTSLHLGGQWQPGFVRTSDLYNRIIAATLIHWEYL